MTDEAARRAIYMRLGINAKGMDSGVALDETIRRYESEALAACRQHRDLQVLLRVAREMREAVK